MTYPDTTSRSPELPPLNPEQAFRREIKGIGLYALGFDMTFAGLTTGNLFLFAGGIYACYKGQDSIDLKNDEVHRAYENARHQATTEQSPGISHSLGIPVPQTGSFNIFIQG
jgi:hypothetical protein